ncbi:hypothetical protein, partial [Escherichia coli]|uniref:hypothetical protein n=1 Tax=Escherichia coli TaxID=562 RepID=UPI0038968934
HTDCPLTDFGGKTSIFSHPVYLFLRKFSLQDSRGGSDTPGWCFRERLLDEAKRMTQDALKDTSRMENENRSG